MRLIIFTLLTLSLLIAGCGFYPPKNLAGAKTAAAGNITNVCYKNYCFKVEVATSDEQRARGLMYRQQLPLDAGMLFIFPQENLHNFWMKNTLIPLDIIWLDKDKKIVDIKPNAPPCQIATCPNFQPNRVAQYVLEINAGLADKMGLKISDYLSW